MENQEPTPRPDAADVPAAPGGPDAAGTPEAPGEARPAAGGSAAGDPAWRCCRCDRELVEKRVVFTYLGHTVAHEVPACPQCGRVLISKELAEGRMSEVEQTLEDK